MPLRLAITAILLTISAAALAQPPQLTNVWPAGGAMGSKVSARIEGANFAGATAILIGGQGVKAQIGGAPSGSNLPITLEIAPDAPVGARELRVVTPKGVSNPGYVWVGVLPEIVEVEPNDQPARAMMLDKLPVTVNGRMDAPEDVDWYGFHADAGETMVFAVCADRIYSPIDPFLELRDSAQHLLATGMEGYDRDPRVIYTFKTSGEYRLQVRDTMYRGGGGYVYRLSVGKLPVITSLTPAGGKRGESLNAAVDGVNIGDMKSVTIPLPADMPVNEPVYVTPQTPNGPALPIGIVADDNPQMSKGASSAAQPQIVSSIPITINGRIGAAKEADDYQFHAEPGKPVHIRVAAHWIGSRLHPFLKLFDKSGKELLNTEEQIGRDPQVNFAPPAAGDYRIELTSVDAQGGPDYYYRLILSPPGPPDFSLSANPDVLSLGRGQSVEVTIRAARSSGFNGEITIKPEALPAGITASPLTLGPGQLEGSLTLTAAADAATTNAPLRFVGEGMPDGKTKVTRTATPMANLPRPGEGRVVPRAVGFPMVTATDAVPRFTLSTESPQVTLNPGQTIMLKVKAARKPGDNGANGAINLELKGLPPGVTAETPAIPEKQGEVTIKLIAAGDAKPSSQNAVLTGKLGNDAEIAPALLVTIKPK